MDESGGEESAATPSPPRTLRRPAAGAPAGVLLQATPPENPEVETDPSPSASPSAPARLAWGWATKASASESRQAKGQGTSFAAAALLARAQDLQTKSRAQRLLERKQQDQELLGLTFLNEVTSDIAWQGAATPQYGVHKKDPAALGPERLWHGVGLLLAGRCRMSSRLTTGGIRTAFRRKPWQNSCSGLRRT
jgi:hypothetical protein